MKIRTFYYIVIIFIVLFTTKVQAIESTTDIIDEQASNFGLNDFIKEII